VTVRTKVSTKDIDEEAGDYKQKIEQIIELNTLKQSPSRLQISVLPNFI